MTFIKQLKDHIGGLVRLKTPLYWYNTGFYDEIEERICILLDAVADPPGVAWGLAARAAGVAVARDRRAGRPRGGVPAAAAAALLLIDGSPKWVWISERHTELIK